MNTSGIIHKTVQLNSETLPELIQSIENDITIAEDILQSSDAFAQFLIGKPNTISLQNAKSNFRSVTICAS